jgi:hypothetical protein
MWVNKIHFLHVSDRAATAESPGCASLERTTQAVELTNQALAADPRPTRGRRSGRTGRPLDRLTAACQPAFRSERS